MKKRSVAIFSCVVLLINILICAAIINFRTEEWIGEKNVPRDQYHVTKALNTPEEFVAQEFVPQEGFLKCVRLKLSTYYPDIEAEARITLSLEDENGTVLAQKEISSANLVTWGYHLFEINQHLDTSKTYSIVMRQPVKPIEGLMHGTWHVMLGAKHVPGSFTYYLDNGEQVPGEFDMLYCYEAYNRGLAWVLVLFDLGVLYLVVSCIPAVKKLRKKLAAYQNRRRSSVALNEDHTAGSGKTIFAWVITCIMTVSLAVWPFGKAAVRIATWANRAVSGASNKAVLACLVLGFIAVAYVGYNLCSTMTAANRRKLFLALFCASFISRVFVCMILQAEPISDFLTCYDYAVSGVGDGEYLARFPYLGMYTLTLRAWFGLVGDTSVLSAQILNALITSLIPIIIYRLIFEVSGKANTAFVGAFAYAFFPDLIIYTAIPSCEHFSQFFLILSIYLFVRMKKAQTRTQQYIGCAAIGISLALMQAYKHLFLMVMPAILMANICYELIPEIAQIIKGKQKNIWKLSNVVVRSAIIVLVAILCSRGITGFVQKAYVDEVPKGRGGYAVTIYCGLAKEGQGVWNADVVTHAREVAANAESKQEIWDTLIGELVEDYQNDIGAFVKLMENKFDNTWGVLQSYYGWAQTTSQHSLQRTAIGSFLFMVYPAVIWGLICAVTAMGLLLRLFKKHSALNHHVWFILTGCVFLFAIVCLVLEAQKRYTSSFMPGICVMFAIGFDESVKHLEVAGNKIQKVIYAINGETSCEEKVKEND